jgi:peptidoglycan/LPS O-acetylase OafA/YrhL
MKETSHLHNLTPLRGVAALLVVIYHTNMALRGALAGGLSTGFFDQLYLMVDLFFMISGFVLCHVYGDWFKEKVSLQRYMKFSAARFARIYPLYLFTLICLVLVVFIYHRYVGETPAMFRNTFDFDAIPLNIFLLQSMNTMNYLGWNIPSWSVSVEWWVYMLFPLIIFLGDKLKLNKFNALFLIVCALGYLLICMFLQSTHPAVGDARFGSATSIDVTFNYGFLRCLLGFSVGMIIYQYFLQGKCRELFSASYFFWCLLAVLLVFLHLKIPDYITVWLFPCLILAVAYGSHSANKLLDNALLKKLGDISYSIYLTHMPILFAFVLFLLFVPEVKYGIPANNQLLAAWIIGYAFISITLLISYFTYTYVELPARNAIKAKARL